MDDFDKLDFMLSITEELRIFGIRLESLKFDIMSVPMTTSIARFSPSPRKTSANPAPVVGYLIRTLERDDLVGYLELLGELTVVEKHTQLELGERFGLIGQNPFHQIFVMLDKTGKLLACATLLIEPKFIRGLAYLGHIEDVCVKKDVRGSGCGKVLVEYLTGVASSLGCYKISLNCSSKNVGFYESCGFERTEIQMTRRELLAKL